MPTCFEIYETYQRGPAAVLRLFEEALGTPALYGPPPPDMRQRTIDSLSDETGRLQPQVSRLKAALGEARGGVDRLRRRNTGPEQLVAKDSHNSSRPPSTDPPWARRTKSLRRPSGRRVGGQPGHAGRTLRLTPKPHRVMTHHPTKCRHCNKSVSEATRRAYGRAPREFFQSAGMKHPSEVVPADVLLWRDRLRSQKQSSVTVAFKPCGGRPSRVRWRRVSPTGRCR